MSNDKTIHVLLLEDDADDYRIVAKQLRSHQCRFVLDWCEDLTSAIQKLKRRHYDVVLTDLCVPDSNGFGTLTALKKHCMNVPVIVLTGADDDSVARAILKLGAQDYLIKEDLRERVVTRAIVHAVQRQESLNEVNALVLELEQSQQLLAQQSRLLKKKNRRLRRLYKTAQEFVDNVSHDLRAPLTVITSYVSIIRAGIVGETNDEQRSLLDKVSIRADDLNNMVDDLLDVSKLESGLLGACRRNTSVGEIIERATSMLEQRAQLAGVELTVDCDEELPDVYCDVDKAVRVIVNLAINAIKFCGDPGKVRLWVQPDPASHQVIVGVSDNGPGIEKESLEKLFGRFQQLGNRIKSSVKGFGLGLNIAQQLCQLNLGELSVQSQLERGSTFSFTIPMASPPEVTRRWLTTHRKSGDAVRVVEISIDGETESSMSEEFDSFLNCLLRRDDILFRAASHKWLLLMAVCDAESSKWFERAKKEFARANRNRPLGHLPDYQAETTQRWGRLATNDTIVQELASAVASLDRKPSGEEQLAAAQMTEE